MQIDTPVSLFDLIAQAMQMQKVIEVGTFTEYSALCIAKGLPIDRHLMTCDVS